jgi:predicted glutamine amidotransferase
MCRMLGVKADRSLVLTPELVTAENALRRQSVEHPDGWGIAEFGGAGWTRERGIAPALDSRDFVRVARRLHSATAIAHVRKASVGGIALPNTHPFLHGGWAFAHNGTVQAFDSRRASLERAIDPALRRRLEGETDSEHLCLLFLTYLVREPHRDALERSTRALLRLVRRIASSDPVGIPKPSSLNILCSDGDRFLAFRFNRELSYTTGAASRRHPARTGRPVSELVVASEPTGPERLWRRVANGAGLATDNRLRLARFAAAV